MEFRLPDFETVVEAHDIVIEGYGGLKGMPHPEYIRAAISRPQSYMTYDTDCDLNLVTAIILDSLARYHAFADGNKRTALLTMLLAYNLNGIKLAYTLHVNEKFERLVLEVAEKEPGIKFLRRKLKVLMEEFTEV